MSTKSKKNTKKIVVKKETVKNEKELLDIDSDEKKRALKYNVYARFPLLNVEYTLIGSYSTLQKCGESLNMSYDQCNDLKNGRNKRAYYHQFYKIEKIEKPIENKNA